MGLIPASEFKRFIWKLSLALCHQQSPGLVKMPMLQIDPTCTHEGKERWLKTAGKPDSSRPELSSASTGLCHLSVEEVKDEVVLNKILHLNAGKSAGP